MDTSNPDEISEMLRRCATEMERHNASYHHVTNVEFIAKVKAAVKVLALVSPHLVKDRPAT